MKICKFVTLFTLITAGMTSGASRVVVDRADFITGDNTNGWRIATESWQSPVYDSPVASVSLTGTNLANGASFTVINQDNAFKVTSIGGAKLTSFSATYAVSKLLPPTDLQVTNLVDAGFTASWSPVPDAIGYRLNFYSNVLEGAVAGSVAFEEAFSLITVQKSTTAFRPDELNTSSDTRSGWFFSTCYYGPVAATIQIGSSSTKGWLALPWPIQGAGTGNYTLSFAACRFKDAGANMPVSIVSKLGTTNWLGSVTLSGEIESYLLPLPAMSPGDAIYFHSTTNKSDGRVVLDSVRILEGYDPGHVVAVNAGSAEVRGTSFATNGLPAVDYRLSVTALAETANDDSDESPRIDLPLAQPPLMPVLRAYPISRCVGGVYEEDFSALSAISGKTPWYNGVSPLPYWMCYRDNGTIVTEIGVGKTNTATSGLFKFRTDLEFSEYEYNYGEVLGWRGTSDRSFYTGIAFVNDTTAPRVNFSLGFQYCQWNYRNKVPMTNTVEYLVTNQLVGTAADGDWVEIPALELTPGYTSDYNDGGVPDWWSEPLMAEIPNLMLKPGEYLVVRFNDPKTSSSGGLGITQFKLTSERKQLTSCIIFR